MAEANFSLDLCTVSRDIHHIIDITLNDVCKY